MVSARCKAPPTRTYVSATILQRVNKMSRRAISRVRKFPSSQQDDESHRLPDLSTVPKHRLLGPTCRQPSDTVSTKEYGRAPGRGPVGEKHFLECPRANKTRDPDRKSVQRKSCQAYPDTLAICPQHFCVVGNARTSGGAWHGPVLRRLPDSLAICPQHFCVIGNARTSGGA